MTGCLTRLGCQGGPRVPRVPGVPGVPPVPGVARVPRGRRVGVPGVLHPRNRNLESADTMHRTLLALTVLAGLAIGATPEPRPQDVPAANLLWYRAPAANWNEALPVGNGRLAVMVFGAVRDERLQLNED